MTSGWKGRPDGGPWERIDWAGGRDGGWGGGWGPGIRLGRGIRWTGPLAPQPWSYRRLVASPASPRVLLPLALAAIQVIGSTFAGRHQPQARALDVVGYLLLLVGPVGWLVLRRRRVVVCALAVGAAAVYLGVNYPVGPVLASAGLSLLVAVASGRRTGAWIVGVAGLVAAIGLGALAGHPVALGRAVAGAAWLVVVLVVGEAPRYRAEQFAAARRARAAESKVAESALRLELARDLHDTIGHSLSMIAVQAGVALHLLDEHPEQARPALAAIRNASREALDEVRSTLSILRDENVEANGPPPGLDRVDELVEAARVGGMTIRLKPDPLGDSVSDLPPAVDTAAYRFVQEALTNVARHSAAETAIISVRRSLAHLEVSVVDDGLGADAASVVEGNGLRGMRERAEALGGAVEAGSRSGRGFRVAVRFPLGKDSAPS